MTKNNFDYLSKVQTLNDLLERMQSGELDIDQALSEYQKGLELLEQLENHLKKTVNQITKLKPTA